MRTLPLRLGPLAGESLPGYIARYAAAFGIAPGDVREALGLTRFDGMALSEEQAERAAAASGIAPRRLHAMTLGRYADSAFALAAPTGKSRLPRCVLAREVSVFASRACPGCLAEDRAWLLRWQLGWSLLCPRHRVLLISICPACGARLGPPRRAPWPSDRRGELRDPRLCSARAGEGLCRARLADAPAIDLTADPELVAAQRRLGAVLEGEPRPRIAGAEVEPLAYLGDLRALAAILRGYPEFAAGRLRERLHAHGF